MGTPRRPTQPSSAPQRMCVGCRRRADRSALLRLVADDGRVVVDRQRRASGRGANIHDDPECVEMALRRRAIQRALRLTAAADVDDVIARVGRVPS